MTNLIKPKRNYSIDDGKEFLPLINSSNGDWIIRYLWIQHRFENDLFLSNYFKNGNSANLNVRKQTSSLIQDWSKHNRIFENSTEDGNLIWRFKTFNKFSMSIDYIEVWRSKDIVESYFDRSRDVVISDEIWLASDREIFAENLWNAGFDIRTWLPYMPISRDVAEYGYRNLLNKSLKGAECILNTPWNKVLNP